MAISLNTQVRKPYAKAVDPKENLNKQEQGAATAGTGAGSEFVDAANVELDSNWEAQKPRIAKLKPLFDDLQQTIGASNLSIEDDAPGKNGIIDAIAAGKITVTGKDGQTKTKAEQGDIITFNSAKYGQVRIEVGGDGTLDGGDDKILSVGQAVAGNAVTNGLNQINTPNAATPPAANPATPQATAATAQQAQKALCPVCSGAGCPTCNNTGYITKPQAKDPLQGALGAGVQANNINPFQPFGRGGNLAATTLNDAKAVEPATDAQQGMPTTGLNFNPADLQNLLAAIMHNSIFFMDQFQQNRYLI